MYRITKRMEISAAHELVLPYSSKCCNLHGHNWIIEVEVESKILDSSGLVVDFSIIKEEVMLLDHSNINEGLNDTSYNPKAYINPTAENIAKWVWDKVQGKIKEMWEECTDIPYPKVSKVTVQESEGNTACYIP